MKRNKLSVFVAALAAMFVFTQCTGTQENKPEQAAPSTAQTQTEGIKIAYVNIDSLLNNYKFSVTLRNEMLRKGENMRMTLAEKAKAIQADMEDFQRKVENNVYATRQARILKSQEEYGRLEQRLVGELSVEENKNNITLRDSINNFLKDYNKAKGYDLILSRMADNILLANESLDITKEVIDGLNERYSGNDK